MAASNVDKLNVAATTGTRFGAQTFFGYFTQVWAGPCRINIFHGPDPGAAMHDHTWDFVSFPLVAYVEQYLDRETNTVKRQVIHRFRPNRKPAEHVHRYIGKWAGIGTAVTPGKVMTLCWTGKPRRTWYWWRADKGKVRRFPWQPYLRRILKRPHLDHINEV